MTIFDWLNEITGAKRSWNEFNDDAKESFNPYMINRFISMKRDCMKFDLRVIDSKHDSRPLK